MAATATATARLRRTARAVSATAAEAAGWEASVLADCADPGARRSDLSGIGDPVEWQCLWDVGSGRTAIRLTLDPLPGGSAEARRGRAIAAVPDLTPAQIGLRRSAAAAGPIAFGGWVGLRQAGRRRKLYLEVPAGAPWRDWKVLAPIARLSMPTRAFAPLLLGLDPVSGAVELYGGIAPLAADALPLLCCRLGLPGRSAQMLGLIAELAERGVRPRLPMADQGLSLSIAESGQVAALTWYTHADALLGPAAAARRRLLAIAAEAGWQGAAYRRLTEPYAAGTPWHGVAGVTLDRAGRFSVSVTCATRAEGDEA